MLLQLPVYTYNTFVFQLLEQIAEDIIRKFYVIVEV